LTEKFKNAILNHRNESRLEKMPTGHFCKAGLIGIDGNFFQRDQVVWARATRTTLSCTTTTANNVMAMIKNALRVPSFAPALA
jgi:hypothetical protein